MHLQSLHSLRGLLAVVVLLGHSLILFQPGHHEVAPLPENADILTKILRSPIGVVADGDFAVNCFFILSGVVLTLSLLKQDKNGTSGLRLVIENLTKRWFRLAIPAGASVLIAGILLYLNVFRVTEFENDLGRDTLAYIPPLEWSQIFKEASYQAVFLGASKYNPVLWTVFWELYGSLLLFVFHALFRNSRALPALAIGAVILLVALNKLYLAEFLVGMIFAQLFVSPSFRVLLSSRSSILLSGAGLFIGGLHQYWELPIAGVNNLYPRGATYWNFAGSSILIFSLMFRKQPAPRPATRFSRGLSLLGDLSFGVYLLHTFVLLSAGYWFWLCATRVFHLPYLLAALFVILCTLGLTVVVGIAFRRWIEIPSVNLGKRMASQLSQRL